MLRYHLQAEGGEPLTVEIRDGAVRVGEAEVPCEARGPGELLLRLPGRTLRCHYARRERTVFLWLEGRTWHFELSEGARPAASSAPAADPHRVTAPMPGSVRKLLVEPGQEVAADQPVAVLESMKMEISLAAPRAGRVAEVRCAVGDMVEMGDLLVALEEP